MNESPSETKVVPEYERIQIIEALADLGWDANWFTWEQQKSSYGNYEVSKLCHCSRPDWFIVFDVNRFGARISRYSPGDDDLQPMSTRYDTTWEKRISTVREWAQRINYISKGKSASGLGADEGLAVVFIEAGSPRTAHLEVAKLFVSLQGDVLICDPYYGAGSFLRLDLLVEHCKSIRFLTQRPDSAEKPTLPKLIAEFKKQHSHVVVRRYGGSDLHDRYILTAEELILLGHGLKDIGNKESFVIRLPRSIAGDLLETLRTSFDERWDKSAEL